jgi:hypothetical protein
MAWVVAIVKGDGFGEDASGAFAERADGSVAGAATPFWESAALAWLPRFRMTSAMAALLERMRARSM